MSCNKCVRKIERLIHGNLASVIYKIVVTVILDKSVSLYLLTVDIHIAVDHSVFDDHLAFCVKIIISCRHRCSVFICMSCNKCVRKIERLIHGNLASVIYKIVVTVILDKSVSLYLLTVDIHIAVDHTVFDDHLAFCVKIIITCRHRRSVRICNSLYKSVSQIQNAILCNLITIADKVIIAVGVLYQTISLLLIAVQIIMVVVNSRQKSRRTVYTTIVIAQQPNFVYHSIAIWNNSRLHISLSIE